MSDSQGPGGGALEPHPYSGGFGPPPNTGKHPYSPPTTSSGNNGLTDLSSSAHHPHLTLLKTSSSSNNHNSIGWLPMTADPDGLGTRLSEPFSEIRYLEFNNWDLSSGYPTAEGLTARLVDNRSIESGDTPIQYRPWEKPDSSSGGRPPETTTTSSPNATGTVTNTTTTTTSNGPSSQRDDVTTSSTPNGVSSTNGEGEKNSPPTLTPLQNAFPTFTDAFVPAAGPGQKLPSFQSQFNSFNEPPITGHLTHQLAVEAAAAANSGLPSFHTLPANGRYIPGQQLHPAGVHPGHPHMVAASPMQAPREQQPFLEERHIQLFPGQVPLGPGQFSQLIATSSPATSTMTITNGHHIHSPHAYHMTNGNMNGGFVGGLSGCNTTTVMTPGTTTLQLQELSQSIHPPQTPTGVPQHLQHLHAHHITKLDHHQRSPQINGGGGNNPSQVNNNNNGTPSTPKRQGGKRKRGENGLINNNNGNGHGHLGHNNHHHGDSPNSAHQVSSVSSTESSFKRPNLGHNGTNGGTKINGNGHLSNGSLSDDSGGLDKPNKKKRKRCGECTGCQRKDNCGECAPCRNDKSHQICKMRRCDKLTEKKTPKSKLKQQQQQQQQQQIPQLH